MNQENEPKDQKETLGNRLLRTIKQGLIQGGIAAVLGALIWLFRSQGPLDGAILFTYIWAICLGIYATVGSFNTGKVKANRLYSPEELQSASQPVHKRSERDRWMDYLRCGFVFFAAILLESIKYYVL